MIARALISVSDKTGVAEFGRFLAGRGVEILSTGGTAAALIEAGVAVRDVRDLTGFPEILDGRVKTLHPAVHGGILGRRSDPAHVRAMADHGLAPIDLVAVDLYPFEAVAATGAAEAEAIKQIDVGGVALIRAAAKNHEWVTVITDGADYGVVTAEMTRSGGAVSAGLRRRLAGKAFARSAAYDAAIASWFDAPGAAGPGEDEPGPYAVVAGSLAQSLRYGENPHQRAAFYRTADRRPGVAGAAQLQGKQLSYNNLADADAAFELVAEFDRPAVAIVKHANPCGAAVADALSDAWRRALACDPVSAFGAVVAVNRPLDGATAAALADLFLEAIIAPRVEADARRLLAGKTGLRLLEAGAVPDPAAPGMSIRQLLGGFLLQTRDSGRVSAGEMKVVTRRAPTGRERDDLLFAFAVCKHVKSNAIVYAKDGATVGIGAGQMSRVDSSRIAARKAAETAMAAGLAEPPTMGSVVASDAFFPFADGLVAAAEAGATAVIQPGGSLRDPEVVAAADERGLAMLFTGRRHFRH